MPEQEDQTVASDQHKRQAQEDVITLTMGLPHPRNSVAWSSRTSETLMRQSHPDNPRLEALLQQQDQLKVQISLVMEAAKPNNADLKRLRRDLFVLEKQIADYT